MIRFLSILLLSLVITSSMHVSSLQVIDNRPRVINSLIRQISANVSQDWSSFEIGETNAAPNRRLMVYLNLTDNLTSLFGEESLYRISLQFSLIDYTTTPLHQKEVTIKQNSSLTFPIFFNATSNFKVYTTLNILSGNTRNSTVEIDFRLDALVIKDFEFNANEQDYSIKTTSFPNRFQAEESFLWYDPGPAFIFLPEVLLDLDLDYLIKVFIEVEIISGPYDGQLRMDLMGGEETMDLTQNSPMIFVFDIVINDLLELSILADTGFIEFELSNITVFIPQDLKERDFDLPDLPFGGIIVGVMFMMMSTGIVYLFVSRKYGYDKNSEVFA